MPSEPPDAEILRQAFDVRSRDLVEARVGLAQAVAALTEELEQRRREAQAVAVLTEELGQRRREAQAAQAEVAAVREHGARDLAALDQRHRAATRELEADLELLRGRRALRYVAAAQRLAGGLRKRGR